MSVIFYSDFCRNYHFSFLLMHFFFWVAAWIYIIFFLSFDHHKFWVCMELSLSQSVCLLTSWTFLFCAWLVRPSVGFGCFVFILHFATLGEEIWINYVCVSPLQTKFGSFRSDLTRNEGRRLTLATEVNIRRRIVEIHTVETHTVASFLTEAHLSGIHTARIGISTKLTAGGIPPPVPRGNNEVI